MAVDPASEGKNVSESTQPSIEGGEKSAQNFDEKDKQVRGEEDVREGNLLSEGLQKK